MKKTDCDKKISDIEKEITDHDHDKYITSAEFNKLTTQNFKARLAHADLVTKTEFDTKLKHRNRKINSDETKHLLVENELKKLKTFDLSYFKGKNYFGDDGTQNYLVFQPILKYFKTFIKNNLTFISSWESIELSNEVMKPPTATDNSLAASVVSTGINIVLRFGGSCLKQDKITFVPLNTVNIFIAYEIIKK